MSIHASKWAWSQDCPSAAAKLVLMALADHANGDGQCWPTMNLIAELVGVKSRTVHDHIKSLEGAGLIERTERRMHQGQFRGWTYCLNMDTASGGTPPVAEDRQWHESASASGGTPQLPVAVDRRSGTISEPSVNRQSVFERFEEFWESYPKRDGKRIGKKQAKAQWQKLSNADRDLAMRGLVNYAAAATDPNVFCPIKDPWRWLRDRLFDDWQEAAEPSREQRRLRSIGTGGVA